MTKTLSSAEKTIDSAESWPSLPTARADLRKRVFDGSICGWLGGKPDLPAVCPSDYSCVRDTEHKYVGCCEKSGLCTSGIYTTCLDHNSAGWFPPPVTQTNGIYICPEEQECYRNTYAGGYSQYGCGKSSWATQVETTFMGQPSDIILPLVYTAVTFSEISTTPTVSLTIETSVTPSIFTPLPSPPTHSDKWHSKKLEPAAIAGVVIGVVNGLAIVAGLAFCVWFRKRRQRRRLAAKGLARHNSGGGNAEGSSVISQMPKILPTPLRISSALASYRSPHTYVNPNCPSPTQTKKFSQENPLTYSDHNRNSSSHDIVEPSETNPNIGLALSSDRLATIGYSPPQLPPIRTVEDDDNDLEYHSIDEDLTDSSQSHLTAREEDVTTSVSLMSGQEQEHENFLSTASVRHVKRVRRSANGGYRLVNRDE